VQPRVLVVDDSPSVRKMVAFVLHHGGYDVVEAADAKAALVAACTGDVRLVITDHNLPGEDGVALIRALRASAQCARTPILMLTTEAGAELRQAARAAGASGWIAKPFDPHRLLALVDKVLA
jgi:two-component system chemotaxis response regulator CheY